MQRYDMRFDGLPLAIDQSAASQGRDAVAIPVYYWLCRCSCTQSLAWQPREGGRSEAAFSLSEAFPSQVVVRRRPLRAGAAGSLLAAWSAACAPRRH
jgi:hypothetical protein